MNQHSNLSTTNDQWISLRQNQPQKPSENSVVQKRNSERLNHLLKVFHPKKPIKSFLDIGCGNAEITQEIGNSFKIPNIYGIDVYETELFKSNSNTNKVQYKQVINNRIELADKSIDLICCFMSIHHFLDFKSMMNEIIRVLKPNGFLFLREHDVPHFNVELKKQLDKMHEEYPDHPGGPINYWPRNELKNTLFHEYGLKLLANSDYPKNVKNKQAIYHSLFILINN